MRVGIFLPNWIGDVVMATPTLRALRKLVGRKGTMVGVMRPYVAEVLCGSDWFDEVITYSKAHHALSIGPHVEIGRRLRAANLDKVVLLTNSFRTAWMAWRTRAAERIGYAGQLRSWLLTHRLVAESGGAGRTWQLPTIDAYLRLAEAAGCESESPRLELATTADDERAADSVWRDLGLPADDRVVTFNPGGAYGAAKHWPAEHFAALAQRMVVDWNVSVLVNCGPSERDIARQIVDRAGDKRVVSLANVDDLPIGLAKACIRRSRLVVTTDSGPRFMGIAFGKPVVTLFGPTDPHMTKTHYDEETCLSLALDCQPCMARSCPLQHHRCMRELTVDRVYAAVADKLDCELARPKNVSHEAAVA